MVVCFILDQNKNFIKKISYYKYIHHIIQKSSATTPFSPKCLKIICIISIFFGGNYQICKSSISYNCLNFINIKDWILKMAQSPNLHRLICNYFEVPSSLFLFLSRNQVGSYTCELIIVQFQGRLIIVWFQETGVFMYYS